MIKFIEKILELLRGVCGEPTDRPVTKLVARVFVARDRGNKPGDDLKFVREEAVALIATQLLASDDLLVLEGVEEVEDGKLYTVTLSVV